MEYVIAWRCEKAWYLVTFAIDLVWSVCEGWVSVYSLNFKGNAWVGSICAFHSILFSTNCNLQSIPFRFQQIVTKCVSCVVGCGHRRKQVTCCLELVEMHLAAVGSIDTRNVQGAHIHTYTHIHTCTHTRTHTNTHTHTHTWLAKAFHCRAHCGF
jgi:hypothetical protein